METNYFSEFADRMQKAGLSDAAIRAFKHSYSNLVAGQTGMIAESSIQPVEELPWLEKIQEKSRGHDLLSQTVVVKLNGGLGTSMGLERAKSLLEVKNGLTFLDFIARQMLDLRKKFATPLRFILMNSFSTSRDSVAFLQRYPELGGAAEIELMQNSVPKVDAGSLRPVSWPANPHLEWCPPGHGDIYPSLLGSGWLDRLLAAGVMYMFVSNADNLGASLDLKLLGYFAQTESGFMMEVAERTSSDRKGGHLARRNGTLLLRESAQCLPEDTSAFQDIQRHRFFNTNNLWVRLDHLKSLLEQHGGFIPLQMIKNAKTVDPRDKQSPQVFQLETAMGAAIECFGKSSAVVVPRSRFAPVKTTSDLLALRSDAYTITDDWRIVLDSSNGGQPPAIDLDQNHYKLVDQLDEKLDGGAPSLKRCLSLTVRGPVRFNPKISFAGKVTVENKSGELLPLAAGSYSDCTKTLP